MFSEILEYAKKIGINIEQESHLLHLAKEGVVQKLPPEWKPWYVVLNRCKSNY